MGVPAGPGLLSLLRNREARLLWPALLALLALALTFGAGAGALAADRPHAAVECLTPGGEGADTGHGPDLACCSLACAAGFATGAGLPSGDAMALVRLEPQRFAGRPVTRIVPPPPAGRTFEPPRGPPLAI